MFSDKDVVRAIVAGFFTLVIYFGWTMGRLNRALDLNELTFDKYRRLRWLLYWRVVFWATLIGVVGTVAMALLS